MGVVGNHIVVSVRSDDSRIDVDDFCANIFGRGNAGGKEGSGGAKFPLGAAYELIVNEEMKESVKQEVVLQLKDNIFNELGEHKEEE